MMKQRLKKICAFVLCMVALISCFAVYVAADEAPTGQLGYLTDAGALITYQFVNESTGATGTSSRSFSLVGGDVLFSDTFFMNTYSKASLYNLGSIFMGFYEQGLRVTYAQVTIRLATSVPLPYFWLYATDPAQFRWTGQEYMFSNFKLNVESPGGVTSWQDVWYSSNGYYVLSAGSGSNTNYWRDYYVEEISFIVNPYEGAGLDGMQMIAGALGYNTPDYGMKTNYLQLWADNGSYRFYFNSQVESNIREEGYQSGYYVGYDDGTEAGKALGYNSGYIDGKDVGFSEGRDEGYDIGYDIGFSNGQLNAPDSDIQVSMGDLFFQIVDAPVRVIVNTLDFNFLGVNLAGLFKALFTLVICFGIFTVLMKALI